MSGPRVGLIGARRKRQGLGPFVARDLRAAGVEVACLLGTSPETARAAREKCEALQKDMGTSVSINFFPRSGPALPGGEAVGSDIEGGA